MWVRGREAYIQFTASDPTDTITFEIQDALGNLVHTVTSSAPAASREFIFPVSYQVINQSAALHRIVCHPFHCTSLTT